MSSYTLKGPKPTPFAVSLDNLEVLLGLPNIIWAFLCGGLMVYGWSLLNLRIKKKSNDKQYATKAFGPYYLFEPTVPGSLDRLRRPEKPLELYEFEICPFCKKVREVISYLDLNCMVFPCPKEGKKWRPQLIQIGGKAQFPYLRDPNTGKEMYESDAIIKYLFNTYGPGENKIPLVLKLGKWTILLIAFTFIFRKNKGRTSRAGTIPNKPLTVYNYEGSPFTKPVREALCELEIPYYQVSVARGSPKRQEVYNKYGHFQAPLIEDPNTGTAMFESKAIV